MQILWRANFGGLGINNVLISQLVNVLINQYLIKLKSSECNRNNVYKTFI
jgi:hypothetical protein